MTAARTVVIGSVAFTAACVRSLVEAKLPPVAVLGRRRSPQNSDFVDVVEVARRLGLGADYVERLATPTEVDLVRGLQPDVLLVLGWSHLLPQSIRRSARVAVGSHPAPLPIGRGRNPISWAIALGLPETALTLFELADEPDAGPIMWQRSIPIREDDDAATLHQAIETLAQSAVPELVSSLAAGTVTPRPQDPARAVVWRRRTDGDRTIDWRMSSRSIDRSTRSSDNSSVRRSVGAAERGTLPRLACRGAGSRPFVVRLRTRSHHRALRPDADRALRRRCY